MANTRLRSLACCLSTLFLSPLCTAAFDTPLSDTAVREAYFLGQHHDEVYSDFLQKYGLLLPAPKSGPHIAAISFLTPYALAAIHSNQQSGIYSAQQAQIDHNKQPEVVHVVIELWFTSSYGAYLVQPAGSGTPGPRGFLPRSPDFWHDFRVRVIQNDQLVVPSSAAGEPQWNCGGDSGCELAGARLTFEYLATAFSQDSAVVLVTPPEGDPVSVEFDLASLR